MKRVILEVFCLDSLRIESMTTEEICNRAAHDPEVIAYADDPATVAPETSERAFSAHEYLTRTAHTG